MQKNRQNIKNKLLANFTHEDQANKIEKSVEKKKYLKLTSIEDFIGATKRQNTIDNNSLALLNNQSISISNPNLENNMQKQKKPTTNKKVSRQSLPVRFVYMQPQIPSQIKIEPVMINYNSIPSQPGFMSPIYGLSRNNSKPQFQVNHMKTVDDLNKSTQTPNPGQISKSPKIQSMQSIFSQKFPDNIYQRWTKFNKSKIKKKVNNTYNESQIDRHFKLQSPVYSNNTAMSPLQLPEAKSPFELAQILKKQSNQLERHKKQNKKHKPHYSLFKY